jgi:fused signal recognition particle receptor
VAFELLKKLGRGISRTAQAVFSRVGGVFGGHRLSFERLEDLEATLHGADLGRETVGEILEAVQLAHRQDRQLRSWEVAEIARHVLRAKLAGAEGRLELRRPPEVICLLGINGVGKTTGAAKLGHYFSQKGRDVLLGSCDTFRTAANEQIQCWGDRLQLEIVRSQRGGDAAAAAFDALSAAIARGKDLLILDTAGRLHTKANLLDELGKLLRVLRKRLPEGIFHRWLVVDGSLGTNSLEQARQFHGAVSLTGLMVTKLDGSSRGGSLVAIHRELNLPIYFVGCGEGADDLVPFSVEDYLDGLLGPAEGSRAGKG